MSGPVITIVVNEQSQSVPDGCTVGKLRDQVKPGADVLVVNGFPSAADHCLKPGDQVVLIRRGEIPEADELQALMVARHTPGVHERMNKSTVGIAGLGGLGSSVAIALARMGVGRLILADFDLVEPSNLNRQQYSIEHIGMPKINAMRQILADTNPYIQVITHKVVLDRDNVSKLFRTADVIVECLDSAEAKAMFIQTVAEFLPETYVIGASGLAGYGDSNSIQTTRLGQKIFVVGDLAKPAEPGRGLMAPRVGIAAHHQANLVVSLLMDGEKLDL
jgi:sulfur carrier protein ThiS adenylyltransferase